jgi:hypothetical protein
MNDEKRRFEAEAGEGQPGFAAELWDFVKHNTKWWLTPIILALLLVTLLILLSGSAAAPFIYTLF